MRTLGRLRGRAGLIALNACLLLALILTTFTPLAGAQRGAGRAPGQYTMVAGRVQGLAEAAIYVVDANNQEMVAVWWDRSASQLRPIGFRDLSEDGQRARGGGR